MSCLKETALSAALANIWMLSRICGQYCCMWESWIMVRLGRSCRHHELRSLLHTPRKFAELRLKFYLFVLLTDRSRFALQHANVEFDVFCFYLKFTSIRDITQCVASLNFEWSTSGLLCTVFNLSSFLWFFHHNCIYNLCLK